MTSAQKDKMRVYDEGCGRYYTVYSTTIGFCNSPLDFSHYVHPSFIYSLFLCQTQL